MRQRTRCRAIVHLACAVVAILLAACSAGPNLSGEWRARNGSALIVTQEGSTYFVKAGGNDFMGRFKEEGIAINSQIGDIKYSSVKNSLFWAGEEYLRKEFLEAEAKRIQADMDGFVGLWKKVPHEGGESVAPFISIQLTSSNAFRIAEIQSYYGSSAFRNTQYINGTITGTFWFTIDNEHENRFEIRKVNQDVISVTMGDGTPESFRRHLETDVFTGNWVGYYSGDKQPTFSFTITKVLNRYRIAMTNRGTSGTLFANGVGGKVVIEGRAQDFYKFQIPTIEVRGDGEVWYSDGADEVKLTRAK